MLPEVNFFVFVGIRRCQAALLGVLFTQKTAPVLKM